MFQAIIDVYAGGQNFAIYNIENLMVFPKAAVRILRAWNKLSGDA